MDAGSSPVCDALRPDGGCLELSPPGRPPEPCTPAELRALVLGGENESDLCEKVLAQVARIEGALDLEIGDGLAALCLGDRLISLGFSSLKDYAREILDVRERTAQTMAHVSRELRSRPLLRAAARAGEVRGRAAQTVLPVATGDAEAEWVERARHETIRALSASRLGRSSSALRSRGASGRSRRSGRRATPGSRTKRFASSPASPTARSRAGSRGRPRSPAWRSRRSSRIATTRRCVRRGRCARGYPFGSLSCSRRHSARCARPKARSSPTEGASF